MTLILSGMRDRRKYVLESDSGVWTKTSEVLGDEGALGFSGFADIRRVGLIARHRVFVAVYALGGKVWVRIGDRTFDLDASAIRMKRFASAPLVKTFEIWEGDVLLLRHRYWWVDYHDWPGDDAFDIFLYIPANLGTIQERHRIGALWSLMQKGMRANEAARIVEQEDLG